MIFVAIIVLIVVDNDWDQDRDEDGGDEDEGQTTTIVTMIGTKIDGRTRRMERDAQYFAPLIWTDGPSEFTQAESEASASPIVDKAERDSERPCDLAAVRAAEF